MLSVDPCSEGELESKKGGDSGREDGGPGSVFLQRFQPYVTICPKEIKKASRNASQALMSSLHIQDTSKRDLHREFYTLLISLCLEKRWIICYAQ